LISKTRLGASKKPTPPQSSSARRHSRRAVVVRAPLFKSERVRSTDAQPRLCASGR
jgi:hypothetical protein